VATGKLRDFLDDQGQLKAAAFILVDWEAIEDAFKDFAPMFQLWATKHISGHCGVGRHMKLRGEWETDQCPCCEEVERTNHIVICPDPIQEKVWDEAVDGLAEWFVSTKIDPDIVSCICDTLRVQEVKVKFATFAPNTIAELAGEQDEIGWLSFTEGRILARWKEAQEVYYTSIGSNRSPRRWAHGLVQQLLSMVHKMWIARNAVVHERDDNGRLIKEKKETEKAIETQFDLEYEDLRAQDWHLIEMGQEAVLCKTANEQRAWLHNIWIAREIGANESDSTLTQLRNTMARWLRRGY